LPSSRERAAYLRCLATLFESGVPLLSATELLSRQTDSPVLAQATADMARQLSQGHRLSQAMRRHPGCFSAQQLTLVRVGEDSGRLGGVLLKLAQQEEGRSATIQRLRSALILPLIISACCLLLVTFFAPLVLGSVLTQMQIPLHTLPWPSRLLMLLSAAIRNPLSYPLLLLVGVGAWTLLKRIPAVQKARWLDQLPGIGSLLRLYATTQFAQTLETTLTVGLNLIKSLEMSVQAAGHPLLEERMPTLIQQVKEGDELSQALAQTSFFPPLLMLAITAGQESGSLPTMLGHLSSIFQVQLEFRSETFCQALEPLLMALMGALVGLCVIATLLPLSQVVQSL
jgi:type II secretory pathway component PulF